MIEQYYSIIIQLIIVVIVTTIDIIMLYNLVRIGKSFRTLYIINLLIIVASVLYFFMIASDDLSSMVLSKRIFESILLGNLWLALLVSSESVSMGDRWRKRTRYALMTMAAVMAVLVFINPMELVFSDHLLNASDPLYHFIESVPGVYRSSMQQVMFLVFLAFTLLIIKEMRRAPIHKIVSILIVIISLSILMFCLFMGPHIYFNLDQVLLLLMGEMIFTTLCSYAMILNYRFTPQSLVKELTVDKLQDALIAVNDQGTVSYANEEAERLLRLPLQLLKGMHVSELIPCNGDATEDEPQIVRLNDNEEEKAFIRIIYDLAVDDKVIGHVYVLREVSSIVHYADAAGTALEKIQILNSITRHDTFNQIMVINGFLELMENDVPKSPYLSKIQMASDRITYAMEFNRQYEGLGRNLDWYPLGRTFYDAYDSAAGKEDISLEMDVGNAEIYADSMIERAFYNLVHNSIVHGGDVSKIRFSIDTSKPGTVSLIYEDNGRGIPYEEKKKIFRKGYGNVHGLGLFLCLQIFNISRADCQENGEPGKGARFVIDVPCNFIRHAK